jgi:transcriptional regulator with XRE-family HTH domain
VRLDKGLTQDDLADGAFMDAAEVRRIESGRRDPGVRVTVRVAHGLGIPPEELYRGIDPSEPHGG